MKPRCQSFWLPGSLSLFCLFITSPLQAQIIPDATLPNPSIVTPDDNTSAITGGTQAGANLFHSFREFSIPTGSVAVFNNSLDIQNIISRITGSSASNIDGLIRANGTANLFLLNPNGIVFGPNARLSIGGSFVGSTASSLNFSDGKQFSATASQTAPLLTVSVPIGLQFGRVGANILVQGSELAVQPDKTLALVGGDITLLGGDLAASGGTNLAAPGGRIELGSLADPGLVSLTPVNKGWALGYSGAQNFQDIQMSQAAFVDASGIGGGDIQVQGRRVTLTGGSQMSASTEGSNSGGTLAVTASESLEISGISPDGLPSGLFAKVRSEATGTGGNVAIETRQLKILNGAEVSTSTSGSGKGGNLTVQAAESVLVSGTDEFNYGSNLRATVQEEATGDGGNLTIDTGRLIVRDGGQVQTTTFGQGKAGNLKVQNANEVELVGGTIPIRDGEVFTSGLFTQASAGDGGNLSISARKLTVREGAQVNSSTFGAGNAGDLTVQASEVELVGAAFSADGEILTGEATGLPFASGLFAGTEPYSLGNGGTLKVETDRLSLRDGAVVQTATFGAGDAGTLSIQAKDSVELVGTSTDNRFLTSLSAFSGGIPGRLGGVPDAKGRGGDLTIETGELIVRDGAAVAVSSLNPGRDAKGAGNLQLTAQTIRLDNQGTLTAETASGQGGNINLHVQDLLLLRRNSRISSSAGTAQTGGDGGNITINTPFLVAVPGENSDITANAFSGRGGKVDITAQRIFGLAALSRQELQTLLGTDNPSGLDPSFLPSNDITAISQTNPDLNGFVTFNVPDIDPTQGLVTLPAELVDTSNQIATACAVGGESVASNKFTISGRGGLPPNPREPLGGEAVLTNWATLTGSRDKGQRSRESTSTNSAISEGENQIVEATGWVIGSNGEVILTAQAPSVNLDIPWLTPSTCSGS